MGSRLLFIDWLRTIAISLVVVRHLLDRIIVHYGTPGTDDPVWFVVYALAGFGWSGVHLFFLVSGYLVGGRVISEITAGRFSPGRFYLDRALRILPAAYVVIVIVGVLFFDDGYLLKGVIKNFAFVQTYTSGGFMSHYWSLCVEMHFYAALPVAAYLFRRWSVSTSVVVATICGFALFRAVLPYFIQGYLMKATMTHWLPDFFAVGILLAMRPITFKVSPIAALMAYVAAAIVVALLTGDPIGNVNKTTWGLGLLLTLGAATLIFVAAMQAPLHRQKAINPVISYIALLSYSIYLVHVPVIDNTGSVTLALVGTAVAALGLHYVVERPFLNLKERWNSKLATQPA